MITKERLEELIKEGATIYRAYADVNVYEVKLSKTLYETDNAHLWKKLNNGFSVKRCGYSLDCLFETKEDAEFALRYQNITRTETLSLPTWEDLKENEEFGFYTKYQKYAEIKILIFKYIVVETSFERYYTGDLTKENYLEACEICRKLFLGEEV